MYRWIILEIETQKAFELHNALKIAGYFHAGICKTSDVVVMQ